MATSYEVDLAVAEMLTRVIPDYRFVTLEDDSADRPRRIDPHGTVWLRDGEPGEPDIDLSPPTYHLSLIHI